MDPTLRQLQAFRAVAEQQHFGRAAERLDLAQPTVSKEIRLLESILRVRLFERSAGGTHLTAEGQTLLPHAEQALTHVDELSGQARKLSTDMPDRVCVAVTPSIVNRLMPDVLRRLETTQPELEVSVLEVDTGEVPQAMHTRKANLGLGHYIQQADGCSLETLGQDELYVVIRTDLAPGDGRSTDLAQLEDVPLLLWPRERDPEYHDALLNVCRRRGLDPLILTGGSRISGSRSYLLRDGRAFSLVPKDFALTEQPPLTAIPLTEPAHIPLECLLRLPPTSSTRMVVDVATRCAQSDRSHWL